MRSHRIDSEEASVRPGAAGLPATKQAHIEAAVQGRSDVLTPTSVLALQRAAGNSAVAGALEDEPSAVHDVIGSGGSPLPADVRTEMEARLGHGFGDVRVHHDAAAHESAQAVNAHAYTVGSDVVFQRDRYNPDSAEGKLMLAHELTHVVQQRNGPVDGTPAPGGIQVSDPGDRFEREATSTAERAMAAARTVEPARPPGAAVQRDADEQPAGPDMTAIQRDEEDEVPEEEQ
jgi:uncharacterized protein DUF4157